MLRFSLKEQPAGVFFLRSTGDDLPLDTGDLQFVEQVVTAAVAALEKAYDMESAVTGQEKLRHLAETDPLTNTYNRRALTEKLEQEMDRAARYATLLTCMMLDIDNFKQINDTHGHLVGDMILRQLAALLKREQRSPDIVARYGGEEFVVLLPETNGTESRNFAERVLRRVCVVRVRGAGQAGARDDQHRPRVVSRRAHHRRAFAPRAGRQSSVPGQERGSQPLPGLTRAQPPLPAVPGQLRFSRPHRTGTAAPSSKSPRVTGRPFPPLRIAPRRPPPRPSGVPPTSPSRRHPASWPSGSATAR